MIGTIQQSVCLQLVYLTIYGSFSELYIIRALISSDYNSRACDSNRSAVIVNALQRSIVRRSVVFIEIINALFDICLPRWTFKTA